MAGRSDPGQGDPWAAAMLRGDFAQAWAISDRVLAGRHACAFLNPGVPRHEQAVWDGRPLDGRNVLVRCYHGLGDTVQFVRLLPALRKRASRVTLWVQPKLMPLLEGIAGADRLLGLHEGAPDAGQDADIELMELPHWMRLGIGQLPGPVPYLPAVGPRPPRRPGPMRVGLCWQAGDWDAARSIAPARLRPLLALPGIEWLDLQFPPAPALVPMRSLACADLLAQARCMQRELDLVVTVDTLTAHLAGALGLPTCTLLPADCDWRWMSGRNDSPWYPAMRLLRQRQQGDWAPVIDALMRELARIGGLPLEPAHPTARQVSCRA